MDVQRLRAAVPRSIPTWVWRICRFVGLAVACGLGVLAGAALQATYSDVESFLIYQNNGTASFQEVPHVHMHVVPRRIEGGWPRMRFGWSRPAVPERAELIARLTEARP